MHAMELLEYCSKEDLLFTMFHPQDPAYFLLNYVIEAKLTLASAGCIAFLESCNKASDLGKILIFPAKKQFNVFCT